MAYFAYQGDQVYYDIQGEGLPLLLFHGLGSSADQIFKLTYGMDSYQIISLDFPGHARSPYPKNGRLPSFQYYTDVAARFIHQLGLEKVIVGGISMGSGISLSLASRFKHLVKAMILIRPAWHFEPVPENLKIISKGAEYISKLHGKQEFRSQPEFIEIEELVPKAAESVLGIFGENQQKELPLVLKNLVADAPIKDEKKLLNIEIPVCIIGNDHDPLHPYAMALQLSKLLNAAQLHKTISRYIDDEKNRKQVQKIITDFLISMM